MRWSEIQDIPCSIAKSLAVIGDRWTLLIIRDCFLGTKRFDDFQKQIGVTRHVLSDRLNKLVEAQVLQKFEYQNKPTRYEYCLTQMGKDIFPIIISLAQWSNKWILAEDEVAIVYKHLQCDTITHAVMGCSNCGEEINPRDILPVFGPGFEKILANKKSKNYLSDTTAFKYLENNNNIL
ncbi:MAG: helix-turn-helix transcriptional regulator [Proteobacteria bacterium]|nr:helix-turn-helix transcriptional regulator [Pseudomonadota bacterium]